MSVSHAKTRRLLLQRQVLANMESEQEGGSIPGTFVPATGASEGLRIRSWRGHRSWKASSRLSKTLCPECQLLEGPAWVNVGQWTGLRLGK